MSDELTPQERLERIMYWFYDRPRPHVPYTREQRAAERRELRRQFRPRKHSKPPLERAP